VIEITDSGQTFSIRIKSFETSFGSEIEFDHYLSFSSCLTFSCFNWSIC